METVIGKLDENSFIKKKITEMKSYRERAKELLKKL
jgi:hypothetical protein